LLGGGGGAPGQTLTRSCLGFHQVPAHVKSYPTLGSGRVGQPGRPQKSCPYQKSVYCKWAQCVFCGGRGALGIFLTQISIDPGQTVQGAVCEGRPALKFHQVLAHGKSYPTMGSGWAALCGKSYHTLGTGWVGWRLADPALAACLDFHPSPGICQKLPYPTCAVPVGQGVPANLQVPTRARSYPTVPRRCEFFSPPGGRRGSQQALGRRDSHLNKSRGQRFSLSRS
jgi:hypothetical protein